MDAAPDSCFSKHHVRRCRGGSNMHSNKTYAAVCAQSRRAGGGVRRVLAHGDGADRGREAAWSIT